MARANLTIESGAFDTEAARVTSNFFGGNFLFDRDEIGEEGTFDDKAAALNIDFFRYPGGTITERFFDLTDPDKTFHAEAHGGDLTPLSEFLSYVSSVGGTTALVVPTLRYALELHGGGGAEAAVRAEIRTFLEALKSGAYGDPSVITHIELGNEYYGDGGFISDDAASYAEIARLYAEEIRAVFGDDVKIAVQAGINNDDNLVILEAFAGRDDLVDSTILHSYPWDLGQIQTHLDLKSFLAEPWIDGGLAEDLFLSEWNISNQYSDASGAVIGPDQIEDGLARAVAVIEMAAGFIGAGFESAAVWPLQQNTRGDLAGDEGETAERRGDKLSDDGLTAVGKAFQLMSESLPGTRLLDVDGMVDVDERRETDRWEPEALVHAFEDAEKIVIFVSAWDIDDETGFVDLTLNIGGVFTDYDVTTLTIAGGDYTDRNADPVTFTEEGTPFDGAITLRLARDYEIKRIILNKPEGLNLEADFELNGGAGADTLMGGAGDDMARGFGGDDLIKGADGFDFIVAGGGRDRANGGAGNDSVKGGGGADRLAGGAGSDELYGGGGADRIRGGAGDDTLIGGGGADRMMGGGGADRLEAGGGADLLVGGAGRDVFAAGRGTGLDTVRDFRFGQDVLEFDVNGFAALDIRDQAGGALVSGGGARLFLRGVDADRLDADDFLF